MALPVTISSTILGLQNSYHGPFKSSEGAFYTVLIDSTNKNLVEAHKATDPTSSFSEQDGSNRPNFVDDILSLNVFQAGDKLHVVGQNLNADQDVYYARFDMGDDTWDAIDGSTDRDIVIDDGAKAGNGIACDLVVRSDGDIVVVYQKDSEKVMGAEFERVGVSVSTSANRGETWSAVVRVDNQGSVEKDMTGPRIVLGDSDTSHIVWGDDTSNTTSTMSQRALSSADSLQTERTDITGADNLRQSSYPISHGISFDRLGTTKVRFLYMASDNDLGSLEFNAASDPSTFTIVSSIDGTNDVKFANSSIGACPAIDGSTQHELHVRGSDSDLFTSNDQDSDTWISVTEIFIGTLNSVHCNVYDRSGPKLAHIYNGPTTPTYDEEAITITIGILSGVDFPDQNYFDGPFEI